MPITNILQFIAVIIISGIGAILSCYISDRLIWRE
jgi:hypothetical protein